MRSAVISAMILMGLIGAVVHKQMRAYQASSRAGTSMIGTWDLVPPLRDPRRSKQEPMRKRPPPVKRPPLPA